jgi:hypothetical protein
MQNNNINELNKPIEGYLGYFVFFVLVILGVIVGITFCSDYFNFETNIKQFILTTYTLLIIFGIVSFTITKQEWEFFISLFVQFGVFFSIFILLNIQNIYFFSSALVVIALISILIYDSSEEDILSIYLPNFRKNAESESLFMLKTLDNDANDKDKSQYLGGQELVTHWAFLAWTSSGLFITFGNYSFFKNYSSPIYEIPQMQTIIDVRFLLSIFFLVFFIAEVCLNISYHNVSEKKFPRVLEDGVDKSSVFYSLTHPVVLAINFILNLIEKLFNFLWILIVTILILIYTFVVDLFWRIITVFVVGTIWLTIFRIFSTFFAITLLLNNLSTLSNSLEQYLTNDTGLTSIIQSAQLLDILILLSYFMIIPVFMFLFLRIWKYPTNLFKVKTIYAIVIVLIALLKSSFILYLLHWFNYISLIGFNSFGIFSIFMLFLFIISGIVALFWGRGVNANKDKS